MRRTFCCVNAADADSMVRGRCGLVCTFTPSDRKIGHTVRSTCVNFVNLPVRVFIQVYTEGSQDRTHGNVSSTRVRA